MNTRSGFYFKTGATLKILTISGRFFQGKLGEQSASEVEYQQLDPRAGYGS